MGRKITIIIEDEKSTQKIFATTTLEDINVLYKKHSISGLPQLATVLNTELNTKLGEDVNLLIPDELNTLPPGKKW